nr:AI-2E family transporter [Salinicola acroporae]
MALSAWRQLLCSGPDHAIDTGGLLALFGTLLGNSFTMFMDSWPEMQKQLEGHYLNLLEWLANQGLSVSPQQLSNMVDDSGDQSWISGFISGLGLVLSQSLVILLMVNFMLFETLDFRQKVARALTNPGPSLERFTEFSYNLKRYMAVKTAISLITGLLVTISAWLVGVEFALLWGHWPSFSITSPTSVRYWPRYPRCC